MAVTSRELLKEYCLRKLGEPVIEVNVDPDQLDDRVDEALQKYREFHADATTRVFIKHQMTADDISNGYITIPSNIIFLSRMFALSSSFQSSRNFFDIKYQMMLNDIADMHNYMGDLAYYEQMQQYLSLLDMKLNGAPITTFSRRQNRLYIHGDTVDGDLVAGDYIVVEAYEIVDGSTYSSLWDDMWLKKYTAALIKRQWGTNLLKFEGMQLPGGVTLNGRQLYEDSIQEIERLEEELRLTFELPPDMFVG